MYIDRNEAIKRIKAALRARSGRAWSVTGGTGTAWGWITVQSMPKQREGEFGYVSAADCAAIGQLFGLDRPVHDQGLSISPDEREFYLGRAEGK